MEIDILPLTRENIKDILTKETTTKNIYRTIVDRHTQKYEIASEMKWNSIRQAMPWNGNACGKTHSAPTIYPMKIIFTSKYYIASYMSIKKYTTMLTTKITSPHSATIAKPREKLFWTHSMTAQKNTRYGNISFT